MASWESLGRKDPAPGNVGALRAWSATTKDVADRALTSHNRMAALDVQNWTGGGADHYHKLRGPIADEILEVHAAHLKAQAALAQHVALLARLQGQASRLLDRYVDAQEQLRAADAEADRCRANGNACESELSMAKFRQVEARTRSFMGVDSNQSYWDNRVGLENDSSRWNRLAAQATAQRDHYATVIKNVEEEADQVRKSFESSAFAAAETIAAAVGETVASQNLVVGALDRGVDVVERGGEAAKDFISSDELPHTSMPSIWCPVRSQWLPWFSCSALPLPAC